MTSLLEGGLDVYLLASDQQPFDYYFPPTYDGIVIATHYTGLKHSRMYSTLPVNTILIILLS